MKKIFKTSNPATMIVVAFLISFSAIGSYYLFKTYAAPKSGHGKRSAVTLSVSPAKSTLTVGQNVTLGVYLNTNGQPVNAVDVRINYPASSFEFVSVDTSQSVFSIEAENSHSSGSITIARGGIDSVNSSYALIANIVLRPIASGRNVKVNVTSASIVASATTNVNILETTSGGRYTIR